jgi:hypothetical protein
MNFDSMLVGSVPLMVVVFGLVEMIKSFGLKGNVLTVVSMLLGVAFGLAYQVALSGVPSNFASWFAVITFGLLIGLVTSGFYKFAAARLQKVNDPNDPQG